MDKKYFSAPTTVNLELTELCNVKCRRCNTVWSDKIEKEVLANPEIQGKDLQSMQVPVRRLDDVLPEQHFHLIKIDVQGAELDIFSAHSLALSIRPSYGTTLLTKPKFNAS